MADDARGSASDLRLAFTMVFATAVHGIDITIVNVALPTMEQSLAASHSQVAWVLTANIIASVAITPSTGWLSARFGRREIICGALAGFAAVTLACAFASSLKVLVLLRIVQGAVAAPIYPLSLAILLDAYPSSEHTRMVAWWNTGVFVGPMIGPTIGGFLLACFGWPSVFIAIVPFIAVILVLSMLFVPEKSVDPGRRLDVPGLICVIVCVVVFLLSLPQDRHSGTGPYLLINSVIFCCALIFLIFRSRRIEQPFIAPDLFLDQNFTLGILLAFLINLVSFGTMVLIPLILTDLRSTGSAIIGLLILPRSIAMIVGASIGRRAMEVLEHRVVSLIGLGLMCGGALIMSFLGNGVGLLQVGVAGLLHGLGIGVASVPINAQTFSTLNSRLRDDGSAVRMVLRLLGGSVGVAISVALLGVLTPVTGGRSDDLERPLPATAGAYEAAFVALLLVTLISMMLLPLFGRALKTRVP